MFQVFDLRISLMIGNIFFLENEVSLCSKMTKEISGFAFSTFFSFSSSRFRSCSARNPATSFETGNTKMSLSRLPVSVEKVAPMMNENKQFLTSKNDFSSSTKLSFCDIWLTDIITEDMPIVTSPMSKTCRAEEE